MSRKLLLISLLLICFAQISFAKKLYYSMQMLTGMADVIVTGKIIYVSGDTYRFNVDKTIKGGPAKKITVKMFREWTCDHRWKKPVPGQALLLFLTKNVNDTFDIINGSTGEIFIEADTLHGIWELKQQTKLTDVITGLRNFIACYTLVKEKMFVQKGIIFDQLKNDAEVLYLSKANSFSGWLFDGMKRYSIEKPKLYSFVPVYKPGSSKI